MEEWFLSGKRGRVVRLRRFVCTPRWIRLPIYYFRFLIFFLLFFFLFFFRIHRRIRSEEEQSGIIINRSKGNNIVPFLEKIFEQCMLRRDNIFHLAIEKSNTRKKRKKEESNHLVTRTDLAPLRNFVIPFRFDHDHGEKRGFCVTFRRWSSPIGTRSILLSSTFSIFYLTLPLPSSSSPFFSKPI